MYRYIATQITFINENRFKMKMLRKKYNFVQTLKIIIKETRYFLRIYSSKYVSIYALTNKIEFSVNGPRPVTILA